MSDLIMVLIFAVSGIIGYQLVCLISRSIDRRTAGSHYPKRGEGSK